MDHREPPRFGAAESRPHDASSGPMTGRRPFARLVSAPSARRPALARLGLALGLGASALALLAVGGAAAWRYVKGWLHEQPTYQLPFREIVLVPPPPAWIRSGREGLLDQVRTSARQPEMLPVLDVDLEELGRTLAFHSPWIESVGPSRRSYPGPGRPALSFRVRYREPVALAHGRDGGPLVVDREGWILPLDDLDRAGAGRLIAIRGLPAPSDPRPGRSWGRGDAADLLRPPEPRAVAAAALAAFLKAKLAEQPPETPVHEIEEIYWKDDTFKLYLHFGGYTWFHWGEAPGAEAKGEPTADRKWDLLLDFLGREGPRALRPNQLHQIKDDRVITEESRP